MTGSWSNLEIEQLRKMIAAGSTAREAADSLDRTRTSVLHTALRHDLGPWRVRKGPAAVATAVPADLVERWREMGVDVLAEHYGIGRDRMRRMCREQGLVRAKAQRTDPKAAKPKPIRQTPWQTSAPPQRRDEGLVGEAARYLQYFGPVYRCNAQGRPTIDGPYWRRGSSVLTDADLIERADFLRSRDVRQAA